MSTYDRPISATLIESGLTGTIAYAVLSLDGSPLVSRTTAGVTESGASGIYSAVVTGWDTSWSGRIVWDAGGDPLAEDVFLPYNPVQSDPLAVQVPGSYPSGTVGYVLGHVASLSQLTDSVGTVSDPLAIQVPGSYPSGTVGNILGHVASMNDLTNAIGPGVDPLAAPVPGSYTSGQAGYVLGNVANLSQLTNAIGTQSDPLATPVPGSYQPGTPGYILGHTANSNDLRASVVAGINSISMADPGSPSNHTTLPKMIAALWRDAFGKKTKSPTQIKRFAANGSTVNSTQAIADDNLGSESVGEAT